MRKDYPKVLQNSGRKERQVDYHTSAAHIVFEMIFFKTFFPWKTYMHACLHTCTYTYCIVGNSQMVRIFAYFEQMQIVQKLEPTKIFGREYNII